MNSKGSAIDELKALQDVQLNSSTEYQLELLVRAAETLEIEDPSSIIFIQALAQLSTRHLNLKLSLHRAAFVEEELQTHLAEVESELALIQKWSSLSAEESGSKASETAENIERRRQGIVRKAKEYQSQLARLDLKTANNALCISDLTRLQEQNRQREKKIREKRKKVEAFRGLPANPDLARLSLLQATQELQKLTRAREGLLGGMADGVS
ncbi:hypothetical protein BT96DRAFT_451018 [Gymnopus androsaceus JB14]|uniref:Uncharacterized protein n=1 Tax=Gymnopus androsaceus JB14 TaxID=1447944 RepID=A0A6A4GQ97_9AGAR|nr:hypothetical protein BT96DRAFT_451018 [Gymnopus androsaceus JB14]